MRLIDADALIEYIDVGHLRNPLELCFSERAVVDMLERRPTVDAVPVVRCKDCKHYDNSEGICWCNLNSKFFPGGVDWLGFPEDGFCSYGERRNDNA